MNTNQIPSGAVVVGVDGSPASDRAVVWGVEQAAIEHRPVVLVHAASPTAATTWVGAPSFDPVPILEAIEESGQAQLEAAVAMATERDATVEVRTLFDHRDPRDSLLDLSRTAGMIVLGSRGRGPMLSLILGSVSIAVSQHASCPVVVLRGDADHDQAPHTGVVVGADGTDGSAAALAFAFRQASSRSLPLTVFHVYWSEQDEGHPSLADDYADADLEDTKLLLAESIAGFEADYPDVKVTLSVQRGFPDVVLVRACEAADLVVVGTHPTNWLYDTLAGEVSRSVLGHARCAVAVVPDVV
jgi:nucleotide-binding universal stress UspA family protein